jgi:hypothetical protein
MGQAQVTECAECGRPSNGHRYCGWLCAWFAYATALLARLTKGETK